jgi:hypothetical protein
MILDEQEVLTLINTALLQTSAVSKLNIREVGEIASQLAKRVNTVQQDAYEEGFKAGMEQASQS